MIDEPLTICSDQASDLFCCTDEASDLLVQPDEPEEPEEPEIEQED